MKDNRKWIVFGASFLLFAIIGVILRWLWSGAFLVEVHSDTVDTLFWAATSHEVGAIANPAFKYGYFIPFGGNLLMQPFVPLFGVGMTTLRTGMSLFILIFAFSAWFFFRSLGWSRMATTVGTALICAAGAATPKMREIYYGHVIYYSLSNIFFFFGCALMPSVITTERQSILKKVCFAFCFAWAASCGSPLLLYVIVPVFVGWILLRMGEKEPLSFRKETFTLLPGIIGTILGAIVYLWMSREVETNDYYSSYYSSFSPMTTWFARIADLVYNWFSLFDIDPCSGVKVIGEEGIPHAIRIVTALLAAVAPIIALCQFRLFSKKEQLLIVSHWVLMAETMFFWVFGNISDANWRICPIIITSVAVTICYIRNVFSYRHLYGKRYSFFPIAIMASFFVVVLIQTATLKCHWGIWRGNLTLIPLLRSLEVKHGYCSIYWFSNVITAVSDSEFEIREVAYNDKEKKWGPANFNNTDLKWYVPNPDKERTVLICGPQQEGVVPKEGLIGRYECRQRAGRPHTWKDLVVFLYEGDVLNPKQKDEKK